MSQVQTNPAAPDASQPGPTDLSPAELSVFVPYLMGWPHWRIAMQTGLSEATIGQIVRRPRFCTAVAAATRTVIAHGEKIVNRLQELAPAAVERVAYLMEHAKAEAVQMKSAFDILDRAGYKPVERREVEETKRAVSVGFNISALEPEDKEALRAIALRAARANVLGASPIVEDDAIDMTGAYEPLQGGSSPSPAAGGAKGVHSPPTPPTPKPPSVARSASTPLTTTAARSHRDQPSSDQPSSYEVEL